jgi:glucose/arabinose dehydrogenase
MKILFTLLVSLTICTNIFSQIAPVLTFANTNITGLSNPVDIVNAGDGTNRIFVVERGGVIKVFDASFNLITNNFLTLTGNFTSGGERGLLSLAFHPNYETNRYFFVYYTNGAGGVNVDQFRTSETNPNQAVAASRTNVISVTKPVVYSNHNGGKLNFGPDGNLYFGLGDSGSGGDPGNLAQNGASLWGKMIRINVDNFTTAPYYTVPTDNPFTTNAAVADEVYNIGLRNPWRWSFDRLNGAMWIADVGQNAREEINSVPLASSAGLNYGWRCYEGTQPYSTGGCQPQNTYQAPIFEYPRNNTTGGFSVTGGYVYRGSLHPQLNGYYICADYVSNNGWLIKETTPNNFTTTLQSGFPANISSFGETESGELLVLSLNGPVFTVGTSSPLSVNFTNFKVTDFNNTHQLQWSVGSSTLYNAFVVEYSKDGISFNPIFTVNNNNSTNYNYTHNYPNQAKHYYRIKAIAADGRSYYTAIELVRKTTQKNIEVINANKNNIQLLLREPVQNLQLLNNVGQILQTYNNSNTVGVLNWPVFSISTGIYFIKAVGKNETISIAVFVQ